MGNGVLVGEGVAVGTDVLVGVGVAGGDRVEVGDGEGLGGLTTPSHPAIWAINTQNALMIRIFPPDTLPRCPPSISVV